VAIKPMASRKDSAFSVSATPGFSAVNAYSYLYATSAGLAACDFIGMLFNYIAYRNSWRALMNVLDNEKESHKKNKRCKKEKMTKQTNENTKI